MSESAVTKLIGIVPGVLWVVFATVVFCVLRPAIVTQLHRMQSLRTPFGEADFAANMTLIGEAAAQSQAQTGESVTIRARRAAVSRLDHAADIVRGGRILWVDDHPEWNRAMVQLCERVGMTVDTARSTDEALGILSPRGYDLVITDMRRGDDGQAGESLADEMERRALNISIIVYAGRFDPRAGVHPAFFAYTTGVDGLVHYIVDVMERVRFSEAV
ncbi:response regulator [Micromonospora saelicesensis]|uniref:response regulator n=1 Tax=Micromonospora saelicesensis TaxID=285676 RepID=UPI003D8BE846